jgi:integrase
MPYPLPRAAGADWKRPGGRAAFFQKGESMSEKRITVWVQRFKDRSTLVLQWLDPDTGKRKSKSAGTADPKEAEEKRKDLEYELTHGKYQEASRMTWERFRELFETEHLPGCRPATHPVFAATFDAFEAVCNPRTLRGVNERTLSAFLAGLRKLPGRNGPMESSTINTRLRFLHIALAWAESQKLIPECPKFPAVHIVERDPQPIPAESFERLLDKAEDPEMKAYLLCGWLAGLRRNEALLLEWEPSDSAPWVNFGRERIVLPAQFVKGKRDQWVPLDPELRTALEALPRRGKQVFHFTSRLTKGRLKETGLSQRIRRLAERAGVRLTMHTLRKGFGCRYAGKVPAQVLQKLMRHRNISLTMKFYANVDDAVEAAVLGAKRNGLRNKKASAEGAEVTGQDATQGSEEGNGEPAFDS